MENCEGIFGTDDTVAGCVWDALRRQYTPYLHGYLRSWKIPNADDRDDIIEETFLDLWRHRERLQKLGGYSWHSLIARAARFRCMDWLRRQRHVTLLDPEKLDTLAIPEEDCPFLHEVEAALLAGQLYHCANALWLGLDLSLSPETHQRQLLAAQLYYLDGETCEDIVQMLRCAPPGEPALDARLVDCWVTDTSVFRYLAFSALYYSREQLAAHLLGGDIEAFQKIQEALTQIIYEMENAPVRCDRKETALILWRYAMGMPPAEIWHRYGSLLLNCGFSEASLAAWLPLIEEHFPFQKHMQELLEGAEKEPRVDAQEALGNERVWQRMAFQYWYKEELPLRDVQARIEKAACMAGYKISQDTLNVWLSGGRLRKRLAALWREEYGGGLDVFG